MKDPKFTSSFWSEVEGLVLTNTKSKETHWKTYKELSDKFGDETEAMMAVLPQRRHPQNPKVLQWMVMDDRSSLAAQHFKKSQISGSSKLEQNQVKTIKDALSNTTMDDSMMDMLESSQKDIDLDSKMDELDMQELPPWLKKLSDAGSKSSDKGKKASMEEKFVLKEEDTGFDKVVKLEGMVRKLLTGCQTEEYAMKSSKYKVDGQLKKDFSTTKSDLKKLEEELHTVAIRKNASKKKIQDMLIRGCQLYRQSEELLKKVQALNKGS